VRRAERWERSMRNCCSTSRIVGTTAPPKEEGCPADPTDQSHIINLTGATQTSDRLGCKKDMVATTLKNNRAVPSYRAVSQ